MVERRQGRAERRSRQVIYGDGGNAGYDATNPSWMFNEFTGGFSDSNFRGGDPEKWVITSAPLVQQRRGVRVLLAADRRPEPGAGNAPDLLGRQARLADVGLRRRPRRAPCRRTRRRTSPGYEANCPEFVTSAADAGCGDYRPLGGPFCDGVVGADASCTDQPGDLAEHRLRRRPVRRLDLVARPRRRRPRHAVGGDLGRAALRDAQRGRGRSGDGRRGTGSTTPPRRRGSRAGSTSTRPTRATRGSRTPGYNAATPTTPGHVFDVHENGPAAGLGHVHEPERRERHVGVPDAVRTTATCRSRTSSATTRRRRCTSRPTSASSAATTTAPAAGT